jgi:hypothetical protein
MASEWVSSPDGIRRWRLPVCVRVVSMDRFYCTAGCDIHLGTVNSALSANYISYDHGARGRSSGWDRLSGAA